MRWNSRVTKHLSLERAHYTLSLIRAMAAKPYPQCESGDYRQRRN